MAYSRDEAAKLIIKAGLELVEKGLIARTWGNISARISDTEFLITPSGMAYDRLTPEKLVVCKIEDCSYEGEIKPSSEKGVHGEAYKYRPDINFVIHTHQLYATVVGAMGKPLYGRNDAEKKVLGEGVFSAKYAISSTKPLMRNVSAEIQRHLKSNAFFMRFHGVLCLGTDYENAFAVSETLEDICQEIICKKEGLDTTVVTGFVPELPEQILREEIKKISGYTHIIFDRSKVVKEMSSAGKRVYPMIDDMAQIAGVSFACVDSKEKNTISKIAEAMKNDACVFVKDLGAVCAAMDESEVEAVQMVLDKNCLAGVYCGAHGVKDHLGFLDATMQRRVYVKKYSKLK